MAGTAFSAANWDGYDEQSATNPSAELTSFPVLIDISTLSATWKSNVQSDGADIRLTEGDNSTEMALDVINWAYNDGAPTGIIRGKYSTLSTGSTENVRVWSGYNAGGSAVAYDATETYGQHNAYNSNIKGYYTLDEASGVIYNRTSASDMTAYAGPTYGQSGKWGSSLLFDDASSQYLELASNLTNLPMTLMGWFKTDDDTASQAVASAAQAASTGSWQWVGPAGAESGDYVKAMIKPGSGTSVQSYSTASFSANTWHHAAGVFTDRDNAAAFLDGGNKGTDSQSGNVINNPTVTTIGRIGDSTPGQYFSGYLDEIQIHNIAQPDAWIALEYAQSSNQSTFWGTWAWTAYSPSGSGISLLVGSGMSNMRDMRG